jgi:hypothetical protein
MMISFQVPTGIDMTELTFGSCSKPWCLVLNAEVDCLGFELWAMSGQGLSGCIGIGILLLSLLLICLRLSGESYLLPDTLGEASAIDSSTSIGDGADPTNHLHDPMIPESQTLSFAIFGSIYELRANLPSKTALRSVLVIHHPSINQVYKSCPTLHAKNVRVTDHYPLRIAFFCTRSRCYISTCGLIQALVWSLLLCR